METDHHDHAEEHGLSGTAWLALAVATGMVLSGTGVLPRLGGVPLNAVAAVVGSLPLLGAALAELVHLRLSADLAVCIAAGAAIAIGQHFVIPPGIKIPISHLVRAGGQERQVLQTGRGPRRPSEGGCTC